MQIGVSVMMAEIDSDALAALIYLGFILLYTFLSD